jgi:hypothetical protein
MREFTEWNAKEQWKKNNLQNKGKSIFEANENIQKAIDCFNMKNY